MKIIRFSAAWCLFCPPVAKLVEKLAGEHNLVVEVIDCTKPNKVANKYKIQALPTVLFVTNDGSGRVLAKVAGAQPRAAFDAALEQARAKLAKKSRRQKVVDVKSARKSLNDGAWRKRQRARRG